jgi:hypothetical protein
MQNVSKDNVNVHQGMLVMATLVIEVCLESSHALYSLHCTRVTLVECNRDKFAFLRPMLWFFRITFSSTIIDQCGLGNRKTTVRSNSMAIILEKVLFNPLF